MLEVNGVSLGTYISKENEVRFNVNTTKLSDVANLSGDLTVTNNDEIVEVFYGYTVVDIKKTGNSFLVIARRNLPEDSSEAIRALEINLQIFKDEFEGDISNVSYKLTDTQSVLPGLLMRANFTDEESLAHKSYYPDWVVGFDYKKDWIIKYQDDLYRIGQDHTSQEQWIPGAEGTTALYSKIDISDDGYETWQEWDGVSGSYAKDQVVRDPSDNNLYKSKIDSNVWGPPSEQPNYWELYTEE